MASPFPLPLAGEGKGKGRGNGAEKWPQMLRIPLRQKRSSVLSNTDIDIKSVVEFDYERDSTEFER
jgi:hypothetical protein